jgi:hypothetical protein
VLAIFALILLLVSVGACDEQPSRGDGGRDLRLIALPIFLIGDLPDVNKVGRRTPRQSFIDVEAKPWRALAGAGGLAGAHGLRRGVATMDPERRGPRVTQGGENRVWLGRREGGEASALKMCASETPDRGQRQTKVCSRL